MTQFYWAKADRALYYLRDRPGGRGPSVGRVWRADTGPNSGYFYHAMFDTPDVVINFTERGQHRTVMAMLEAQIVKRIPDAVFTKEF